MKSKSLIFSGICVLLLLTSCKKEYNCLCQTTSLSGDVSSDITTIESKSRAAAKAACEGISHNAIFYKIDCVLLD